MKLLVNGKVYDSAETPVVIEFTEMEQHAFGVVTDKVVSTPPEMSDAEREALLMREL